MITGKEKVLEWVRSHKFPLWKLTSDQGKAKVISENDEVHELETSIDLLDRSLSLMSSGRYFLSCKRDDNMKKGLHEVWITLEADKNSPGINGLQQPVVNGLSQIEVDRKISEAISNFRRDQELEDLKKRLVLSERENRELEKRVNDPINKIISGLAPHSKDLMENMGLIKPIAQTAKIAVSGPDPIEQTVHTSDAQDRLTAALEMIAETDPENYIEVIEKIALVAKHNRGMYDTFKPMLLQTQITE